MIRFARVSPATNAGDSVKITYHGRVLRNGSIELVEDGKIDLQEQYNSYAMSCDLAVIINRFLSGDVNALQRNKPMFADFASMPQTYAEWLQLRLDGEQKFSQLDADTRAKFGNDVNQFLATAGDQEWLDKLGLSHVEKEEVNNADSES